MPVELTYLQEEILNQLAASSLKDRFYWTGGTLLASQYLHHRLSEDIDLFTDKKFGYQDVIGLINKLQKKIGLDKIEEKRIYDRWEFLLKNKEQTRVEFVFYDFPGLKPKIRWQGILTDSFDDLMANKTMALFDRSQPKDLFDVYCLMTRKKIKITSLLKRLEQKFKVKVSESSLWGSAQKALIQLNSLEPFLLAENKAEKQKILNDTKEFVTSRSSLYLRQFLE